MSKRLPQRTLKRYTGKIAIVVYNYHMMTRLITTLVALGLTIAAPTTLNAKLAEELSHCREMLTQTTTKTLNGSESYEKCMMKIVNQYKTATGVTLQRRDQGLGRCGNCIVDTVTFLTNANRGISLEQQQQQHRIIADCFKQWCPER